MEPNSILRISPEGASRIITVALLVVVVGGPIVGATSASVTPNAAGESRGLDEASDNRTNIGPDEAVEQREQALDRLAELRELDSSPLVSVDKSTIDTVRTRIESGNISYSRANYDDASGHWQVAREQARAALIRHYNLGADRYVNATGDYLDAREAAGHNSPEMSRFREQAQQIRAENASSLQESRNRYQAAQDLNSTVESELPSMAAVRWANRLTPLPMPDVAVPFVLLVLLSITGYLGFRRGKGQTPDSGGKDDVTDTTTETTSTLREDKL
jgi:hypothetical protein